MLDEFSKGVGKDEGKMHGESRYGWSKLLEGRYIEDQSVILPTAVEMEVKVTFKNYVTRILMYSLSSGMFELCIMKTFNFI